MDSRSTGLGTALLAFLLSTSVTLGATFYVDGAVSEPGDGSSWQTAFKSVQEGIDAASDGDSVLVAPGTYFENIYFHGKNITLTSTDPLDPDIVTTTIIDGNQSGSVVTFEGTEDETCLLSGFTIRNGDTLMWQHSPYGLDCGGGIHGGKSSGRHARAAIRNNIIVANSAEHGAGVSGCDGIIQDNTIRANQSRGSGGGLSSCNGVIQDNKITENFAHRGAGLYYCKATTRNNVISRNPGGGLYGCSGIIENNVITRNLEARDGGGLSFCGGIIRSNTICGNSALESGGGLDCCHYSIIEYNIISGNTAGSYGGGLNYCCSVIKNNQITDNIAAAGGGLTSCGGGCCRAAIVNNTVCGNHASVSGGGMSNCWTTIANCIIGGNEAPEAPQLRNSSQPTYCCIQDWTEGGEGNITTALFFDPDGPDDDPATYEDNDYRLSPDSPCIDVGDNWLVESGSRDADGNLRIAFGRTSLTVDMGAYEFNSSPFAVTHMFRLENDRVLLTWASQPGDVYILLSTSDPSAAEWTPERTSLIPSQGAITSCIVTLPLGRLRFYRLQPGP